MDRATFLWIKFSLVFHFIFLFDSIFNLLLFMFITTKIFRFQFIYKHKVKIMLLRKIDMPRKREWRRKNAEIDERKVERKFLSLFDRKEKQLGYHGYRYYYCVVYHNNIPLNVVLFAYVPNSMNKFCCCLVSWYTEFRSVSLTLSSIVNIQICVYFQPKQSKAKKNEIFVCFL